MLQAVLRPYLAHILVGAMITAVVTGSYASVVFAPPATPKAVWALDPLVISFTATESVNSGSATDSVTCSSSVDFVQLLAKTSHPAKIFLAANPTGLPCGTSPFPVSMTVTCLVSSVSCKGSYNGQVQVRQPDNYRNLPSVLKVLITVT